MLTGSPVKCGVHLTSFVGNLVKEFDTDPFDYVSGNKSTCL